MSSEFSQKTLFLVFFKFNKHHIYNSDYNQLTLWPHQARALARAFETEIRIAIPFPLKPINIEDHLYFLPIFTNFK